VLSHGVGILPVDLFCGELHIDHGGLNLAMTHEVHQRRQTEAVAQHVSGEGMTKSVWVGFGQIGDAAVMAEQGPQPGGCHSGSAGAPLEDHKQWRTAVGGPLQEQVMIQQLDGLWSQRQPAQFVSLAAHAHLRFGKQQVLTVECEHFARAQAIQEHQTDDG